MKKGLSKGLLRAIGGRATNIPLERPGLRGEGGGKGGRRMVCRWWEQATQQLNPGQMRKERMSQATILEELGVMGYRMEVQRMPENEDIDKKWL